MIGTSVDRYEIVEELGHGGMSVVYRGRDSALEREVAVKILHNHLAKKLENRLRFHREAKAIARLRHPNILEVYDFSGEDEDRSYIVMEYVEGENLRQFVGRNGHPPPEYAALVALEICTALEHAHRHGIIHRDLKPENVMVSRDGELKLMDFGIAHVIDAETMTATGSLLGSPAHMAPEIIDGKKTDVRADIFALGTVLYWLAAGRLPFRGANAPQVLRRVLEGEYEDVVSAEPRVGEHLGAIIERCLARNPDDRYPSVASVREALIQFIAPMQWTELDVELRAYLKRPDEMCEVFEERIVEVLSDQARAAQRRRDVADAIAYFNRILAYDPENRTVQRLLDSLCRRRAAQRAIPWAVLSIVVLAASAYGAYVWLSTDPEPTPPPSVNEPDDLPVAEVASTVASSAADATASLRATADDAAALSSQVELRAEEVSRAVSKRAPLTVRPMAPRPITPLPLISTAAPAPDPRDEADAGDDPEPARYVYRFSIRPAAASFFVDGKPVGVFAAQRGIELTEGVHTLTATSRGATGWTKELRVGGPQTGGPIPVVLHWEEGRVRVDTNKKSVVWIGERMTPIDEGGRNATFTFPFGPADSTKAVKRITLRVASADDMTKPREIPVTIRPGELSTVQVNF